MSEASPVILFDGVCNFCNGAVNFIIRHDKKKIFRFAALQSEAGQQLVRQYTLSDRLDSFILIQNKKAYSKSTAALLLFSRFSWLWKWTQIFWIIPSPIRNVVYDFIAHNRYKWFGKREECMLPTPDIRKRFIGYERIDAD